MKVYICFSDDDYHPNIEAVFSTKEKAEEWLLSRTIKPSEPGGDDYVYGKVEEYELDPANFSKMNAYDIVCIRPDGSLYRNVGSFLTNDSRADFRHGDGNRVFYVERENQHAPEKERTLKIVNERRDELVKNNKW